MKRHPIPLFSLAAALALLAAALPASAQRIDFPRQSFDRSRFGAPATPATAPQPAVRPAPAAHPAASPVPFRAPDAPAADAASDAARTPDALVAAPLWDLIPRKLSDNPKDYDALLALQRQTGGILLVVFKNNNDSSEKGLCSWYEKSIGMTRDFQRATRPYIKLEVTLPGNAAAQSLAALYKVNKTPAVFVHQPNGRPSRLAVFDWPGGSPAPRPVPDVLADLLNLSTPAYQAYVPTLK